MTTVNDALVTGRDRLRAAAIEDPDIEAEILLRHVLGVDRAAFYRDLPSPLSDDALERFVALIERRLAHEPSAYITGHREFYGVDFEVTPDVLIPRPETETLVEAALDVLKQFSSFSPGPLDHGVSSPSPKLGLDSGTAGWLGPAIVDRVEAMRRAQTGLQVADVGTGSGAIAVTLALKLPNAIVHAIDSSAAALAVAKGNATRHGVGDRIRFLEGDLLSPLAGEVHLIVANLPYVTTADWAALPPELRDHEPRAALDGGEDGLDPIRRLFDQLPRHLHAAGAVCLEFGVGQEREIERLARNEFASTRILPDLAGRPRVLVAR